MSKPPDVLSGREVGITREDRTALSRSQWLDGVKRDHLGVTLGADRPAVRSARAEAGCGIDQERNTRGAAGVLPEPTHVRRRRGAETGKSDHDGHVPAALRQRSLESVGSNVPVIRIDVHEDGFESVPDGRLGARREGEGRNEGLTGLSWTARS